MISYSLLSQTGRLGNQLWEVAATYGRARAAETEPRFPAWDYMDYFAVPPHWFGDMEGCVDVLTLVPHLDPRARAYLQDYALFANVAHEVRELLRPSTTAQDILQPIVDAHLAPLPKPLISVHVRRGDNVTHPPGYHPLRSPEYYNDAAKLLPSGSVVVFSDDPDWCRENIESALGRDVAFFYEGVARPREYADRLAYENAPVLDWIDVQLMALCDHHILSNSSYAWWGAFLSDDPSPIYPSNTFGYHVTPYTDASLMFPGTWRQIWDQTMGGVQC